MTFSALCGSIPTKAYLQNQRPFWPQLLTERQQLQPEMAPADLNSVVNLFTNPSELLKVSQNVISETSSKIPLDVLGLSTSAAPAEGTEFQIPNNKNKQQTESTEEEQPVISLVKNFTRMPEVLSIFVVVLFAAEKGLFFGFVLF